MEHLKYFLCGLIPTLLLIACFIFCCFSKIFTLFFQLFLIIAGLLATCYGIGVLIRD